MNVTENYMAQRNRIRAQLDRIQMGMTHRDRDDRDELQDATPQYKAGLNRHLSQVDGFIRESQRRDCRRL